MSSNAEFIAYCLEEYKAAKDMTGKEVITLFNQYNIIDYIVSCYGVSVYKVAIDFKIAPVITRRL